ncbi:DUF6325 family protein [Prescottella soli]|uniref:DUF6325 family protein n=1 Tax=Prescottella soli TaxID=1543852 RepID=A0ABW9FXI7_9NOCA
MTQPSDIGPVELVVLTFPGTTADPATVAALQDVVDRGYVTLLDLVYIAKDAAGNLTEIDVDEDLSDTGLADLAIEAQHWISADDLDVVRSSLEPGTSAAIIVYEEAWARRIATAARAAGGEVALHVQVPRDAVLAAVEHAR